MITVDDRQRGRTAVRRLFCRYNMKFVLMQHSYYAKRVYAGEFLSSFAVHCTSNTRFICSPVSQSLICPIIIVSYRG
jgi:hypothetical protein